MLSIGNQLSSAQIRGQRGCWCKAAHRRGRRPDTPSAQFGSRHEWPLPTEAGRGGGKGSPAHASAGVGPGPSSSLAPGFSQCCPSGLFPALPGSSSSLRKVAGGGVRAGFTHRCYCCEERHRHGNVDGQAEVINSDTYYFNWVMFGLSPLSALDFLLLLWCEFGINVKYNKNLSAGKCRQDWKLKCCVNLTRLGHKLQQAVEWLKLEDAGKASLHIIPDNTKSIYIECIFSKQPSTTSYLILLMNAAIGS